MKSIPAQLLADLRKDTTAIAFLWAIEMKDGRMIRGTDHDLDITIPSTGGSPADPFEGTYWAGANVTPGDVAASSDMSVDNLEVSGAIADAGATVLDVSVADIEGGFLDAAPVSVLVCDWRHPDHGYFIVKRGFLGAISRDSDLKYTTEVRGMTQLLSQIIVQTFSDKCNVVRLGDSKCKFAIASATFTGTVTAVTSRKSFTVSVSGGSAFGFAGGVIKFTSGLNDTFFREVKGDPLVNSGVVTLWEDLPADVAIGNTFALEAGCDRTLATCRTTFANVVNFRGYGVFIPGVLAIMAGPIIHQ